MNGVRLVRDLLDDYFVSYLMSSDWDDDEVYTSN